MNEVSRIYPIKNSYDDGSAIKDLEMIFEDNHRHLSFCITNGKHIGRRSSRKYFFFPPILRGECAIVLKILNLNLVLLGRRGICDRFT
ncbi:hypothetical protein NPIL_401741 [Nephila pilipes]|uniref:Uncharacterized protein n=1 Tax=Nephila pilipes TaxID=299642 RepID=A0A8X6PLM6_NEPPI|nr:hypothetical protein NPIL_401741 [Nephila pilipes]